MRYTEQELKIAYNRSRGVFPIIEEEGEYIFEIAEVTKQGENYSIRATEIESGISVFTRIQSEYEFAEERILQIVASVADSVEELSLLLEDNSWCKEIAGRRFQAYCTVNEYVGKAGKLRRGNNLKYFATIEEAEVQVEAGNGEVVSAEETEDIPF